MDKLEKVDRKYKAFIKRKLSKHTKFCIYIGFILKTFSSDTLHADVHFFKRYFFHVVMTIDV